MSENDDPNLQGEPHRDPERWDALIERIGPASMMVAISAAMSEQLRARTTPEDIWQETLIHAWRDRDRHQWNGIKAYRGWLLEIARHRILDARKFEDADKRGGGRPAVPLPTSPIGELPANSTSVAGIAGHRERARLMEQALGELPEDLRVIVHLRLIEDLAMEKVARQLKIPAATAWYRFRKGAEQYAARLKELMTLSSFERPASGARETAG